ncbi:crotonase/enoyl-CoA hydratase family protein [Actinomadura rudentiformis]|uniref:Crotonase/enoyl-CoA hydratase family protein n=1 Tax=Actinomadura rudentiformis TaxID=359158 RepID=A0A6H9Y826_9ACTN|nr:crotonase/enoyl-CoA hydratase family protein [Actinomadura rudentiformis]KAB2341001.1 crotonase/enoyl-CoA hydratase family protein [Actinomadura rudentiformis]
MVVRYALEGSVATITMDDGKVNVMSPRMLAELDAALDRALADRAVVLLTGREGLFSAGFDLPTLRAGGPGALDMVRGGFELAARILAFPYPVVVACTGHAIAMGSFLLVAGDHRVGATGSYRISANEVAIGITVPRAAVELLRQRLTPAAFNRAVTLAEAFEPEGAVAAGFLDRVVPPPELAEAARAAAVAMTGLDMKAHAASKLRAREHALAAVHQAIDADALSFRAGAAR